MLMLQKLRETLAIGLIVLLPFHAFVVTVLTKLLAGPGHAPLAGIAVWKEGILAIMLTIAVAEILRAAASRRQQALRLDPPDMLILLLAAVAVAMLPVSRTSLTGQLLGIKYDFVPLIAFFLLRRVSWSARFCELTAYSLQLIACLIALYGITTLFLPMSFFTLLGYSDLHSLYVPDAALAPFQQIGGSMLRRVQSVMSGPNQFGLWLLIAWAVLWSQLRADCSLKNAGCRMRTTMGLVIGMGILLSFSRAAWIGAVVIVCGSIWMAFPRKTALRALGGLAAAGIAGVLLLSVISPLVLVRGASTLDHLIRPLKAVQMMIADPLGRGLGSAGPASNRISDACVYLPGGADTTWAADRPELCVFVADKQMLPMDRTCHCPVLPENWYLQIGVELGVAGMAVFIALMITVLQALAARSTKDDAARAAFLCMLALSIAALVLHAFEDSAVAWTVWVLAAIALSHRSHSHA